MAPHDRQQARDHRRDGHHLGTEPQQRTFLDRLHQRLAGEPAVERLALLAHGLFEVDHHDDRRLDGGAEQRDESDPDGDREVVAKGIEQIDAAGQAEGHGEEHLGGVEQRSIGQVEQHEDHDEHQWDDDLQALASPALVLVLAAPLDVRALGQRDSLGDNPARLFDEAADVAPAHVEQHGHDEQAVLARDHGRP